MRICQIVPRFPFKENFDGKEIIHYHIGGVERHVYEISKILKDKGHSITVLTTQSPNKHDKYHEIDNLDVRRIHYGISLYNSSIPFGLLRFELNDYDLIHAHTPTPMIADLACLKNCKKVPFILTYHNDINKDGYMGKLVSYIYNRTLGEFLLKNSDSIITTSRSYIDTSKIKKFSPKIRIIPNGIDPRKFNKSVNINDIKIIKMRHDIPLESKMVLYVGALEEYKGIKYLLDAFKKILDNENIDIYLFIIGSGTLLNILKEMSETMKISDRVIFPGYVSDYELPYYYSACDFLVLPSISEKEGFGIVQLEAMASGKPVISTNMPGVKEVDREQLASICIPRKDSYSLSKAMIKLIKNEKMCVRLGINGMKLVEEKYSWEKIVNDIEKLYYEVIR